MKSTKDKILQTLLRKPKITINELAEAVGINPISVRHHLTNLQMEGLIAADEERHGVGRPRLVYSLTERPTQEGLPWYQRPAILAVLVLAATAVLNIIFR